MFADLLMGIVVVSVMINRTTCGYDIRYKVVRIRGANVLINSTAWGCNV